MRQFFFIYMHTVFLSLLIFPVINVYACSNEKNIRIGTNLEECFIDTTWDKSSISVCGFCDSDSIIFSIYNSGADMLGKLEYRIYEDDTLVHRDSFKLVSKQNLNIKWRRTEKMVRFETDQRPGHPGNSHPKITVSCSQLPIELVSFSVEEKDGMIEIKWVTSSETNNDFFTVERSRDLVLFDPIILIEGAGNSNSAIEYVVSDLDRVEGSVFYRLKQTDFDGKYSYSGIISVYVDTNQNENFISKIYPNPLSDIDVMNIEFSDEINNTCDIKIFSVAGSLVSAFDNIDTYSSIQLPIELEPGMYVLNVLSNGRSDIEKFMVVNGTSRGDTLIKKGEDYRLIVLFKNNGKGIDFKVKNIVDNFIGQMEIDKGISVSIDKHYLYENELVSKVYYCFALDGLNLDMQNQIVAAIKDIIKKSDRISCIENSFMKK